jgi:hypothetical protein
VRAAPHVADDACCAGAGGVASRVFRWRERSQRRAFRLLGPRLLPKQSAPSAVRGPMRLQGSARAPFGATSHCSWRRGGCTTRRRRNGKFAPLAYVRPESTPTDPYLWSPDFLASCSLRLPPRTGSFQQVAFPRFSRGSRRAPLTSRSSTPSVRSP